MRLTSTRINSRNVHVSLRALSLVGCLTGFGCALDTSSGSDPEGTTAPETESTPDVLAAETEEPGVADESPADTRGGTPEVTEAAVDTQAVVSRPAVAQAVASLESSEDPDAGDPNLEDPDAGEPEPEVPVEDTLCQLPNGDPLPYDYTRGLVDEFAFEVSLDCSVGGFIAPLVAEDPSGLSAVFEFDGLLTDWYRAHVLMCPDATSTWTGDRFGLLPPSDGGLSEGDVVTAISLLRVVYDRHQGLPDGITDAQKAVIEARLGAIGAAAATSSSLDPTQPLDDPSCAP